MIVLGADTHERSHTVAAIAAGTGELLGERTVPVGRRGFAALLRWARGLDEERVWALEDCRHVSGSLERFLIERGERVLRIPTHLTAKGRRSARRRGKSDPIDALNVARAALQEGLNASTGAPSLVDPQPRRDLPLRDPIRRQRPHLSPLHRAAHLPALHSIDHTVDREARTQAPQPATPDRGALFDTASGARLGSRRHGAGPPRPTAGRRPMEQ